MIRRTIRLQGSAVELAEAGQGRPLLFLHADDGADAAEPLLHRLAEVGRVCAPSHPGFGRSDLPAHYRSVDDLAYFYLDLMAHLDLRDAVVVGAGIGGWIAAEIAVRDTARIGHLVLIGAVGARFATDETVAEILDVFTAPEAEVERALYREPRRWALAGDAVTDEDLAIIARNRESFCLFGWSPLLHNPILKNWLHRIDVPALALWGEADGIVAPAYGRAFADAIPGARFATVAEAAHRLWREKPDAVAAAIHDFAFAPARRPRALAR